jgi:hypothetical protein
MADRGNPKSVGELMDGILELFNDNPDFTYNAAGLDGPQRVYRILDNFLYYIKDNVIRWDDGLSVAKDD